jgi:hypothetical protein
VTVTFYRTIVSNIPKAAQTDIALMSILYKNLNACDCRNN